MVVLIETTLFPHDQLVANVLNAATTESFTDRAAKHKTSQLINVTVCLEVPQNKTKKIYTAAIDHSAFMGRSEDGLLGFIQLPCYTQ